MIERTTTETQRNTTIKTERTLKQQIKTNRKNAIVQASSFKESGTTNNKKQRTKQLIITNTQT